MRWPCVFILALASGCSAAGRTPFNEVPFQDGGFGGARRDSGHPPEEELELRFEPPAVGASVLYATNPGAGRVAVIHAADFSIETVAVGPNPSPALAAPGADLAITFQRAASTVSLLRTIEGNTRVTTLPIAHDANHAAFSPDARYAILFDAPRPDVARRNFHDVSVLDLTDGAERLVRVVVGYGPHTVAFAPSGDRAFVLTEDGVSIIDYASLPADGTLRAPLLSFETTLPVREAHIDASARYALALIGGTALQQIDLNDGTVSIADLRGLASEGVLEVTDLDLSPSGLEAVVTVRSHELLARLPIGPEIAEAAGWIVIPLPGLGIGSLVFSPNGERGVGYSTDPSIETVTLLDFVLDESRQVGLRKSVRALAIAPNGALAVVLHHAVSTALGADEDAAVDRSEGYSVIDLTTGFARLALVDATPRLDGFVIEPDGERLLLALRDDRANIRELQVVDLATFAVDRIPLIAPPTTLGVFADLDRAFIGQDADGGRVTFYLFDERATHTVAGFELSARVRR